MSGFITAAVLALLSGVSIVTQQALNSNLRTALNSAAWSGFTSYAVGTLCMILLAVVVRDPVPPVGMMARIPWWGWSGGIFGALYIALAIVLVPKLGAATFVALLVAGQMLAAVFFDHVGFLGLAQRPIDASRLIGMAMLVGAVALIRR